MGHVLGQERSSGQQQNVIALKEKIPLAPRLNGLSFQGKHRARHSFSQAYVDSKRELRQNVGGEKVTRPKSSENDRKPQPGGRACDDNELVKHMSNLPGFLLKVEKDNTIQEKALSFGVLDWKRLEKWKYNERMPGKVPRRPTSTTSGQPKMVPNLRKQPSSHGRNPSSSYSAVQPSLHGSRFSSPHKQPPLSRSSRIISSKEEKKGTYHTEEEYFGCIRSKGKETCSQEYQAAESFRIGRQQNDFLQKMDHRDENCSQKKDTEKEMTSEKEASSSSSKQGKHKISLVSPNKISADGTSECCPADPQNIVLLVPKNFHEKTCSAGSQSTESSTSLDAPLSPVAENRLSDFFSPRELYSGEFSTDIPHSCPLPSSAVEPPLASQTIDRDGCTRANSLTSISYKAECSMMNDETTRPSILREAANRKQAGIAEQPSERGRSPSPARRFSFNLGKMSRSFSFKESSAAPQLNSTYTSVNSGPVRPEIASGMDKSGGDQANTSSRARSSPLRRLLDPFLKNKTTSETVRPQDISLGSVSSNTTGTKAPSDNRKPEASTCQALLQLTFKNELPFFKLVVENSKDMLAAAVKRLPVSEKGSPCMIFSFYSVHEIRKKGMNWMNHGSKSKSYSLGYNIIGQMKISNTSRLTGDACECDARECVLYAVDPAQVDKQIPEFVTNKEIAAIIVKSSSENINDGEFRDKNQRFEGKQSSNGPVVILPGGVHGIPIKGAPSSLINRWKSGGLCDCGGWDVGCKLRILSNSEKSSNILQGSIASPIDHVNLYTQGEGEKDKPVFSLKPFSNELYSIELEASVSLLEAFATSVAYISCSKFPEIIEMKGESEAERSPEANRKSSNTFKEQTAKYVTCPPLSPVGRI